MITNIFVLTGTIIGAGIFSLPFVFQKLKILFFIILFSLTLIVIYLSKIYVEVIKASKEKDQLPVYLKKFLEKKLSLFSIFLFTFSLIGALTGYLMLVQFTFKNIIFFLLPVWFILLLKADVVEEIDDILTIILLGLLGILIYLGFPGENLSSIFSFPKINELSLKNLASAYGVILFSLTGFGIIPELNLKKSPKLSIIISYLIVFLVYSLFATIKGFLNNFLYKSTVIFAIATSYIPLSLALEELLHKDLKMNKPTSKTLTLILPLILTLISKDNFLKAFSITGGVFIALLQALIVIAGLKAKKRNLAEKVISYLTLAVLILGAAAVLFESF